MQRITCYALSGLLAHERKQAAPQSHVSAAIIDRWRLWASCHGWADIATVFADVRPMGSNERMAAMQMQSGGTHVVTVRYQSELASVTGEDRILFGSRTFNIVGIPRNIDERNRVLAMDVTEGGADGH